MSKLSPMPAPSAMMSGRTFSDDRILSRRAFSTFRSFPLSGRIAWNRRSTLLGRAARRIALDEIQLAPRGVALLAVGQLAGQQHALKRPLADHEVAGLASSLTGPGGG